MTKQALLMGLVITALLAGCASAPRDMSQLEQARSAVGRLSSDPLAAQSASRELQAARQALEQAEGAWQAKQRHEQVVHLAYVAERQAQIGEARLTEVRARQQISQAEAERNRVLLEARERQTQRAFESADKRALEAQAAQQSAVAARAELEEMQRKLAELQAQQTERGMVLTLGDVLFDTAQANLKSGAIATLNRVAKFLHENPGTQIIIEGHTDSIGADAYNQELSRRRAAAVAEALEIHGVPADRVAIEGRGEAFPVASNQTAEGRQRNRRVEVVFSDAAGRFVEGASRR